MERERIYTVLHKNRACLMRQMEGNCDMRCKECIYSCSAIETLEMYDTLISMYRPRKKGRTKYGSNL